MSDALDHFLTLLQERIKRPAVLSGFSPAGEVTQVELPSLRPGDQLSAEAERLIRRVATSGGSLCLLAAALKPAAAGSSGDQEVRLFAAALDSASGALELHQASRLRTMVLLAKLQLVGALPPGAKAAGPHLGYQQLYLPGPFA